MKFGSFLRAGSATAYSTPTRSVAAALVLAALISGCGSSGPQSTITKAPASAPVTVSVAPATATAMVGGMSVSFAATVGNSANTAVTWQVNGVAGGNSAVGTISGSGLYLSPATLPSPATVTVTAVTAADPTISGSASLTLTAPAAPVSVSVSPAVASVLAGSGTLTLVATVSNATNTAVTWQVNNFIGGNSTVGTISSAGVYTPPATPPAQSTVTVTAVSVADPTKSGSASVTVTTTPPAPPAISGTPATTVQAGQTYSFTPTASSPRGAALTFSIANKPAWAAFSSATGQLSGTPATTDIGTFSNISISVNDGTATASLAPFTITVQAGSVGSATLTWVAPTLRTDGTPLTNLAGFRIRYGTSQGAYPNSISLANPSLSTYVVDNLPGGATYYFVATAYDSNGAESDYSNSASKSIP
jgi:hypothetical protein